MKKQIALAMVLAVTASLMAGCSGSSSSSSTTAAATTAAATEAAKEAETTAAETEAETEAAKSEGKSYKWVLGTAYNDPTTSTNKNAFGETCAKFAELVNEYTDGQVTVETYFDSVLGGSVDLYDQLTTNEIQVFCGQPMSTADARYGVVSLPGLFTDYDDVLKTFANPDSETYALMQSALNDNGVTMIGNSDSVFRVFYNKDKEIHLPSDLAGMPVRIYEDTICSTYWSGLCAASVIAYSELYTALQTGVVDGVEHTMTYGLNASDVVHNNTDINWQWTWGGGIFVNSDALAELPEDLQEAVKKAGQDAATFYDDTWAVYNTECEDAQKELGINVYHLTDEERAEWTAYGESLMPKLVELVGQDWYDQFTAALANDRAK